MTESEPNAAPVVEFTDVQKSYDGETLVVDDLNLQLDEGEFLTLLGPSGSGKTTTLMMLAGFEPVTDGEIRVHGTPVNNVPPHKRNIGVVFQNYALFPHMTVAENVAYPLRVRRTPKSEITKRVRWALDTVQLGKFGPRRPTQLSGGQQQRVALARALVFEPTLVLMDEPLGALDRQLREQMQLEVKHIQERLGLTVVYVTHDQEEALMMSDRIAVFNEGVVQQCGTPEDIYHCPETAFVADFIGISNRLHGTVKAMSGNGRCAVTLADGSEIEALAVNVTGIGQPTVLSLRPERVLLDPGQVNDYNSLAARIEETIFLGDHVQARLSIENQPDFILKVSNEHDNGSLKPGRRVCLAWRTEDCRALDAGTHPSSP